MFFSERRIYNFEPIYRHDSRCRFSLVLGALTAEMSSVQRTMSVRVQFADRF